MAKRRIKSVPETPPEDAYQLRKAKAFKPLNDEQKDAWKALSEPGANVILLGPAGTGKTFLVGHRAAQFYLEDVENRIILTRPNEPTGRSLGAFPGTVLEKMAPWCAEIMSALVNCLGKGVVECGLKETSKRPARIEVVPLEVMRGRSFNNAFVIMDEAQNSNLDQALMYWTRPSETSIAVMMGDLAQTDIKGLNGLQASVRMAEEHDADAQVIRLHRIVRGPKVQRWIAAHEELKARI